MEISLRQGQDMLFLAMLFMHIFADFNLQTVLANMKQYDWWEKEIKEKNNGHWSCKFGNYSSDYKYALFIHALQWGICIISPIYLYLAYFHIEYDTTTMTFILIINVLVHAIVDHMKANLHWIDLGQDQGIHLLQCIFTCTYIYHLQ